MVFSVDYLRIDNTRLNVTKVVGRIRGAWSLYDCLTGLNKQSLVYSLRHYICDAVLRKLGIYYNYRLSPAGNKYFVGLRYGLQKLVQ